MRGRFLLRIWDYGLLADPGGGSNNDNCEGGTLAKDPLAFSDQKM